MLRITLNGILVTLVGNKIVHQIVIDDLTKVQYKNDKLMVDSNVVPQFTQEFITQLDQAIKTYQLRLQQWIQLYVCNRQQVIKINYNDKQVGTRYLWISDNYHEIRYSKQPLSKSYTCIPLLDAQIEYSFQQPKLLKVAEKCRLPIEYSISIYYKKKSLDIVFITFQQLNAFIKLCNWVLRNRKPQLMVKFSALTILKCKLHQSALKEGTTIKKYLLKQLYHIQTQYTLKCIIYILYNSTQVVECIIDISIVYNQEMQDQPSIYIEQQGEQIVEFNNKTIIIQ